MSYRVLFTYAVFQYCIKKPNINKLSNSQINKIKSILKSYSSQFSYIEQL